MGLRTLGMRLAMGTLGHGVIAVGDGASGGGGGGRRREQGGRGGGGGGYGD
jgi:hypothetical protein